MAGMRILSPGFSAGFGFGLRQLAHLGSRHPRLITRGASSKPTWMSHLLEIMDICTGRNKSVVQLLFPHLINMKGTWSTPNFLRAYWTFTPVPDVQPVDSILVIKFLFEHKKCQEAMWSYHTLISKKVHKEEEVGEIQLTVYCGLILNLEYDQAYHLLKTMLQLGSFAHVDPPALYFATTQLIKMSHTKEADILVKAALKCRLDLRWELIHMQDGLGMMLNEWRLKLAIVNHKLPLRSSDVWEMYNGLLHRSKMEFMLLFSAMVWSEESTMEECSELLDEMLNLGACPTLEAFEAFANALLSEGKNEDFISFLSRFLKLNEIEEIKCLEILSQLDRGVDELFIRLCKALGQQGIVVLHLPSPWVTPFFKTFNLSLQARFGCRRFGRW